jgi:hypothetical protein
VPPWQQYSTHSHKNNTQNNIVKTEYTEQNIHNKYWETAAWIQTHDPSIQVLSTVVHGHVTLSVCVWILAGDTLFPGMQLCFGTHWTWAVFFSVSDVLTLMWSVTDILRATNPRCASMSLRAVIFWRNITLWQATTISRNSAKWCATALMCADAP